MLNLIAIVWVVFITIILSIPDSMRAGKAMAVLTLVLAAWYLIRERHRFHGPAWATAHPDTVPANRATDGRIVSGG
jgi:hypothetical protein